MAFRDENVAAHERIEALEEELERAREQLRERPPVPSPRVAPSISFGAIVAVAFAVASIAAGAYVFSEGGTQEAVPFGSLLVGLGGVFVVLAIGIMLLPTLLFVVTPNQLAVVSGRRRRGADGRSVGYRLVRSGRLIRIPFIERVDFMDLTNCALDLRLGRCHTRRGEVVAIRMVANVKLAGDEPLAHNAVERFLGRDRAEIKQVASETLEGALRGVAAQLTVEELREDKLKVADHLMAEAESDLSRLGFVLDTAKILRVEG